MDFQTLLSTLISLGASDLHLKIGVRPYMRLHGELLPMLEYPECDSESLLATLRAFIGERKIEQFLNDKELDMACSFEQARLRINLYMHLGTIACALRILPNGFMPLDALGIPLEVCYKICSMKQGLVLVTGATGSGKSTTLASIINQINATRNCHIFTIEDPVEYIHENNQAFISQREVGDDTASFPLALRRVLREDPDVVMIGEMRDVETMRSALTLAETGHLTLATLHTSDAVQTMNRLIGSFSADEADVVRTQLASVLRVIISQQLIPTLSGDSRVMSSEILVSTPAIQAQIRENKLHQIFSSMQMGRHLGMRTMEDSLFELVQMGKINEDIALEYANNKESILKKIR